MSNLDWFSNVEVMEYPEIKLLGLSTRTINLNEFNPVTAKIGPLVGRYWNENIFNSIPNRIKPGITYSAYTNYATNEHGEYDYLIGEEVSSFASVPEGLTTLIIPASKKVKLTTKAGVIPLVVIEAWQNIWKMSKEELGGIRSYTGDLEVYDIRASNPMNAILDICLAIK